MKILSIDVGTYSVKILEFAVERKKLVIVNLEEILLRSFKEQLISSGRYELPSISDIQNEIIKDYLVRNDYSGKVIQKVPENFITTRFLNLPINNKRKAESMIPFQLDDNLPYSVSDSHYTADLIKTGNTYFAILNIAKSDSFEDYYNELNNEKILPTHLYGELAALNSIVPMADNQGPYCILDIGHSKTQAYFVNGGKISSNHSSYFGGEVITEVISETYQISADEAEKYKHENSFFLTENQMQTVSDDQREFAAIMKQTILPLLNDIKRWDLGFRVQNGIALEKIYITGGTSSIENIENFLTQVIGIEVKKLPTDLIIKNAKQVPELESQRYTVASVLAFTQLSSTPPTNFLHGKFASGYSDSISVYSAAYIATRVFIVSLILAIILIIDIVGVSSKNSKIKRDITKMIKTPSLQLTNKERRSFKRKPSVVKNKLERKEKAIKKNIGILSRDNESNAIIPLSMLSKVIGQNNKVDLVSFNYEGGLIIATFKAFEIDEFTDVRKRIESAGLDGLKITLDEKQKELNIEFKE